LRKLARRLDIPYERVSALHSAECAEAIRRHRPDVVLAQVTKRVRPELLELVPFWNKHCGLLPGYAGVYPVFWALLNGEPELGVTIYEMDEEFDRGVMLQQLAIRSAGHTFFSAYHALHDETVPLLDRALRGDVVTAPPRPEIEPSYFSFPTPEDRAAFRSAGRRFGSPFRLHPRVELDAHAPTATRESAARGLPSNAS
jgi:methionyl-tRNA formyltransferase